MWNLAIEPDADLGYRIVGESGDTRWTLDQLFDSRTDARQYINDNRMKLSMMFGGFSEHRQGADLMKSPG